MLWSLLLSVSHEREKYKNLKKNDIYKLTSSHFSCICAARNADDTPSLLMSLQAVGLAALSHSDRPLDVSTLPRPLALSILLRVRVDTRLRCAEVNRAWRALCDDQALWVELDLSEATGPERVHELLMRAAVAKARGQLCALDVTGRDDARISNFFLGAVAAANARTLTVLRASAGLPQRYWEAQTIEDVLRAAPRLHTFELSVHCTSAAVACNMLRNEPPFTSLVMRHLDVHEAAGWGENGVALFSESLATHRSLKMLAIHNAPLSTAVAMNAIVDAAVVLSLPVLLLLRCHGSPTAVPALTRLLASGALRHLEIEQRVGADLFEMGDAGGREFATAARASQLSHLTVQFTAHADVVQAVIVINAREQMRGLGRRYH